MKRTLILAIVALATTSTTAFGQIFGNGTDVAIPDSPAVSSSIIVAGGPASITDLNVCVALTHTFDGDLDIILDGPAGVLRLANNRGGSGDNYGNLVLGTTFDDEAGTAIGAGAAPFAGSFIPDGGAQGAAEGAPATTLANLAAYDGFNSNASWTLWLNDTAGGDIGNLEYWSLSFNGAGADPSCRLSPPPPPPATDLGSLSAGISTTMQAHAAAQIHWFKLNIPAIGSPDWLTLDTLGSALNDGGFGANDTEIGLYDATGVLLANNDDIEFATPTRESRINVGTPPPQFPAGGASLASLAAGDYYIAVGGYNTTFGASGFNVTSTSTTTGSIKLNVSSNVPEPSTVVLLAMGCFGLLRRRR